MKTNESCEAEFVTDSKEVLIRRESRHRSRDEKAWMTGRLVEVVTKPKDRRLEDPHPGIRARGVHRSSIIFNRQLHHPQKTSRL